MKKPPIIGFYGYWVILTYCGVASAVSGIYFALHSNIKSAVVCLMISGICDMFDGSVARLAKRTDREKSFGIQIDSLADIICFGILPAVIGYAIFTNQAISKEGFPQSILTIAVICIYVLAALIRLAYFNVTETELQNNDKKRQYYEGLPVTNAAFIIPAAYSICLCFGFDLPRVYPILLILLSLAFVWKIKIPKIAPRYLAVLCLIGLPVILYILRTV